MALAPREEYRVDPVRRPSRGFDERRLRRAELSCHVPQPHHAGRGFARRTDQHAGKVDRGAGSPHEQPGSCRLHRPGHERGDCGGIARLEALGRPDADGPPVPPAPFGRRCRELERLAGAGGPPGRGAAPVPPPLPPPPPPPPPPPRPPEPAGRVLPPGPEG